MWGITDDTVGIHLLRRAFELGINSFDTADVYGDGKGETMLADGLGSHRDEMFIATKFGYDFYNYPGVQAGQRERAQDWSPTFLRNACEESLRRLSTDHIDLYQLHNPRLDALQSDDLFAELDKLVSEGKIRSYGGALGPALRPARQIEEGIYMVSQRKAAVQIIYNMLEQQLGEQICPVAEENGAQVLVRVPHASGLLEGHFDETTEFAADDHRHFRMHTPEMRAMWYRGLKKVEQLDFLTAEGSRTLGQAALQFLMAQRSIASIFPNIYNENQIQEFISATEAPPLSQTDMQRVTELFRRDFDLPPFEVAAEQV